jgi:hypothetical protein
MWMVKRYKKTFPQSYNCESHLVYHNTLLLKYIHTIKATCFSYKQPLSDLCIRADPYLVFGVRLESQLFTLLMYCCIQCSNLVKNEVKMDGIRLNNSRICKSRYTSGWVTLILHFREDCKIFSTSVEPFSILFFFWIEAIPLCYTIW